MTTSRSAASRRDTLRPRRASRAPRRGLLAVGASLGALLLLAIFAIAPPATPDVAGQLALYIAAHPQTLSVSERVSLGGASRDGYSATAGIESLAAAGTNYDWARLVLLSGGWPQSEANVTVMVRWMRQENGTNSWWNRNNPMNLRLRGWERIGQLRHPDNRGTKSRRELATQSVVLDDCGRVRGVCTHEHHRAGNLGLSVGLQPLRQWVELAHDPRTGS
jgi:hypothetical protein